MAASKKVAWSLDLWDALDVERDGSATVVRYPCVYVSSDEIGAALGSGVTAGVGFRRALVDAGAPTWVLTAHASPGHHPDGTHGTYYIRDEHGLLAALDARVGPLNEWP